jgi:UDP-glucose:(heptosyl)LPS alpha-1,3-glucosyltransferase
MRVAIVINAYDTARGGVERYADTLARALLAAGHSLDVIAGCGTGLPEGAALHRVKAASFWSPIKTFAFSAAAGRAVRDLAGRVDAVLGLARTARQDVYRVGGGSHQAWLRALRGAGAWRSAWNPRHAAILAMERRIFSGWRTGETRRYLCNAARVRDEIVADYGVPAERIDVLHNPVDLARFDPDRERPRRAGARRAHGVPEGAYLLLFVGSGFRRKGLDTAIRALARAREPAWLLVAGGGNTAPYRALARDEAVADRVVFAGRVADVAALYAAGDALLAPTRYDPFSNAALEALAMGLPVVTTAANGASEVISEGREGFVAARSDDVDALARAIERLADPALRAGMGAWARKRVETLSPAAHVEALVPILRRAAAEREAAS